MDRNLYMTLLMGATMGVVMLAFMLEMYEDAKKNLAIVVGNLLLFATGEGDEGQAASGDAPVPI